MVLNELLRNRFITIIENCGGRFRVYNDNDNDNRLMVLNNGFRGSSNHRINTCGVKWC
jgi:hypothetical protein